MKIVSLFGKGSIGKSTTLKMLIAEILEKYNCRILHSKVHELTEEITAETVLQSVKNYLFAKRDRRRYVGYDMNIVLSVADHKIGITTMGDDINVVKKTIAKFEEYGCELCFCATHPQARYKIKDMANNVVFYSQREVNCYGEANFMEKLDVANKNTVELLMSELAELLN